MLLFFVGFVAKKWLLLIALAMLIATILYSISTLNKTQWIIHSSSGQFYWETMLGFISAPVGKSQDKIIYALFGADHTAYISVAKQDAEQAFLPTVKQRISKLIDWMSLDSNGINIHYRTDLMSLTGKHFKYGSTKWRKWWTNHKSSYAATPKIFSVLLKNHIQAEKKTGRKGFSSVEFRRQDAIKYYHIFLWRWRILFSGFVICILIAVTGIIGAIISLTKQILAAGGA